MKKLLFSLLCFTVCFGASAQTYPGYLQITLQKNLLTGVCNLDSSSNTIYIHSGAGYKSTTSLFDAVVGNWGMDDGIGRMTTVNDSTFTICMDLTQTASNYFSNVNTANADSGVMPVGRTVYNIGCVFRDKGPFPLNSNGQPVLNNHLKGGGPDVDARGQCSDIWLLGVNTGTVDVEEEDELAPMPAVTTAWVNTCATATGVNDISGQLLTAITVSPNPFKENVKIQFNMVPDVTKVSAIVFDVMGKKVADFTPSMVGGFNSFQWDGNADMQGNTLPAGMYLLKVTNGSQVQTAKLIKL